jgi:hypothetical protein
MKESGSPALKRKHQSIKEICKYKNLGETFAWCTLAHGINVCEVAQYIITDKLSFTFDVQIDPKAS